MFTNMRTKVQLKYDKIMPFGGIFYVISQFERLMQPHIDKFLGDRTESPNGYSYGEIVKAMACNFFCGGSHTEDIKLIKEGIEYRPGLRVCSPDTVLRSLTELATDNVKYMSKDGKEYSFNLAERLNGLLVYTGVKTGFIRPGREYDFDFDHEYLEAGKYDAAYTYKHFYGYSPGCAVLSSTDCNMDYICGLENRDGNANVKFGQEGTIGRLLLGVLETGARIRNFRADCGSYKKEVVKLALEHCGRIFIRALNSAGLRERLAGKGLEWRGVEINSQMMDVASLPFTAFGNEVTGCRLVVQRQLRSEPDIFEGIYTYRAILTNDHDMTEEEVIEFYNKRGAKERVFDQMDNDFGWGCLPKSFLNENTVFLILTAIIRNFYRLLLMQDCLRNFGIYCMARMKTFTAKFVSVAAKWTKGGRYHILNLYTSNKAYEEVYKADFG